MSEVLSKALNVESMDYARRLSRAFEAAEDVKECLGCGFDDDIDGKIQIRLDDEIDYFIPCPLLNRQCRYGQALGERLDNRALANVRAISGLPTRFHKPLTSPKLTQAIRGINVWEREGFLLLHGEHGTGKSFGAAYALYLIARNMLLRDWKFPSAWGALTATWASAYRVTTKDDLFELARVTPVLVIDDLGSEENTNRVKARVVEIVSERYNQQRITVLTTNDDALGLEERYGKRMTERILGSGKTVYCSGESMRLTA